MKIINAQTILRKYPVATNIKGDVTNVNIFTNDDILSNMLIPGKYVNNISLQLAPRFHLLLCDKNTLSVFGAIV